MPASRAKDKRTYALIDINGFYPDAPGSPSRASAGSILNRGILQQQTNNTWSALNYTALEITAAKNLAHGVQFVVALNRQWQHLSGTWNPTDPARFIQPDAFANNKMLPMARGNNENDSYTQLGTYGPTWLKYSMRFGGTWYAPHGFVIAPSLIVQAGPGAGLILDRLAANYSAGDRCSGRQRSRCRTARACPTRSRPISVSSARTAVTDKSGAPDQDARFENRKEPQAGWKPGG